MGWRMKHFNILGVHWKIRVLNKGGRGVHEKPIYRGNCLKREGGLARTGGFFDKLVVFLRGEGGQWHPNAHHDVSSSFSKVIEFYVPWLLFTINHRFEQWFNTCVWTVCIDCSAFYRLLFFHVVHKVLHIADSCLI